jgi:hypothetical protein
VFIVVVILIRILSLQKFTELILDMTLFFTFYLFKRKKNIKNIKRSLIIILIALIPLILISYDGDTNIFKGRLMAQSQLAYYINNQYGGMDLRFSEAFNLEFNNFFGNEIRRIELFNEGSYYGLFKLMELSHTGRDLLSQAAEGTSSSGSIPIIYIYYFGYFFGYFFLILSLFILKFIFDFFVINIVKTNNVVVVFFATLIFLRIYKFFIIGSPSYIYNVQFLFYSVLCIIFMKIKIIHIKEKNI